LCNSLAYFSLRLGLLRSSLRNSLGLSVPLGLWGLYTYIENNSTKKLDEKFGIDLRSARLSALAGALVLGIAYTYGLYAEIPSFYPYLQMLSA
jgi:hypothetical protein